MKTATTLSRDLLDSGRLDAAYFLGSATAIRKTLNTGAGHTLVPISSLGEAYAPSRFKRTYAVNGEDSVPYLRPYDVFEYLPPEADRLSATRTENLANYVIREGDILQTCSGRNLGPVTIADTYLAQFALSHDMIRVRINNPADRFYVLAFLRSRTGQHLLRGDRGGSVISHITTAHVGALRVPFVAAVKDQVVDLVMRATELRQTARLALHAAVDAVDAAYPPSDQLPADGWTAGSTQLRDRFDSAYHARSTQDDRETLTKAGGISLGAVAEILKPGGRHKMVYVEPGHGQPLLSGRQILQCDVVALKYLAAHSAQAAGGFALVQDSVIFQSDGRAEEGLGYPAYVTAERDGWLASGHVGRAIPKDPTDAGWIWACMASDIVRRQVVALSCGSVVDALYPEDVAGVLLPPRDAVDSQAVRDAWIRMAEGTELLSQASTLIDEALGTTD